ncbi:MAG TPA: ester cyclase [Acidimicrobiales bacterium]|nr:ester cyclase [Acidimicrobiales bacterium]
MYDASDSSEVVKRFELGFRRGDLATIDELADPDLIDHNPALDHESTLADFKEKVAFFCKAFPDLAEDLVDIVANGDTVATRWVLTGSLQQEFMGIAPAGQTIRIEGMNFYHLEDGRVTDIWTQFDSLNMMQQIGAIPT